MVYSGEELFFLPSSSQSMLFWQGRELCTNKSTHGLFPKPKSNSLIMSDDSILLDMIQKQIKVIILIKISITYSRGNTWSMPNLPSLIFKT